MKYYHGSAAVANNSGWMAAVDGSKLLSQLSVVGTHNSMSLYGGDIVQTQSMSLINQLNSGVRALDIRVKYDDGNMAIYHGIFFQYAYLGNDVFSVVSDFLLQNPTETIIMHIQQEENDSPVGLKFGRQIDVLASQHNLPVWNGHRNPRLENVRGKLIVTYRNFSPVNIKAFPLSYFRNSEQGWVMSHNWELHDKWQVIKGFFKTADNDRSDTKYRHSLAFSKGVFPYFAASGHVSYGTGASRLATGYTTPGWSGTYPDFPRVSCFIGICTIAFEGLNTLAADYIGGGNIKRLGVLWADFPGKRLINNVNALNLAKQG
ncbi:phosphatidylinositol-specific phospholipase C domain-containing protein [Endozoicomonas sp. ONNA2]|uniref:phosphatidylinositol-specific phospholipase C domain-containing protein n=1 Tax=Endozoicomonas sp. ONNA2 TaxID=2828741 RepID=UPI0021484671|nr:phosphatidylinositol-specific phospholipase C domain-containing protein [Endozoicomonas sp. ONNA2]